MSRRVSRGFIDPIFPEAIERRQLSVGQGGVMLDLVDLGALRQQMVEMAGAEPKIELLAGHWPPLYPGFLSIAKASTRLAARRTYSFLPDRRTRKHRPLADAPAASARDQNSR